MNQESKMANAGKAATYGFSDISEGLSHEFRAMFSVEDIDGFAELSGDFSPIHVDEGFARSRGFIGRVVHGVLLGGLVSRMVGMHLPGVNALLQSINLKFHAPVYAGEALLIRGVVDQFSSAMNTLVLKVTILDDKDNVRVQSKVQVGLTQTSKE